MGMRQLYWGSAPPIQLMHGHAPNIFGGLDPPYELAHGHASIILGVSTPHTVDAWDCVKFFLRSRPP